MILNINQYVICCCMRVTFIRSLNYKIILLSYQIGLQMTARELYIEWPTFSTSQSSIKPQEVWSSIKHLHNVTNKVRCTSELIKTHKTDRAPVCWHSLSSMPFRKTNKQLLLALRRYIFQRALDSNISYIKGTLKHKIKYTFNEKSENNMLYHFRWYTPRAKI